MNDKEKLRAAIKLVKKAKHSLEKATELAGGIEGATDSACTAVSDCDSSIQEMEETLEELEGED